MVEDEDEELIEPTEGGDVLTMHMGTLVFLKNYHKRKISDTKDEDFWIDCRFNFESVARIERLFNHYKYIKIETRIRLTPQIFEAITFWKVS